MSDFRLGAHISIEGGFINALERAKALCCDTMQIFARSPVSWRKTKISAREAAEFKRKRASSGISPLAVHSSYLVNLSSPQEGLFNRSVAASIDDIRTSDLLGAEYFVCHLGSHMGSGEKYGIKRFCLGLNRVMAAARPKLKVLLETTAGPGSWLGYKFEHLRDIFSGVRVKKNIGVCLDTAHVFAAGYDISDKKGLNMAIREFDRIVGLEKIRVIHLNDSRGRLGSRIDRHENIGKGAIGMSGIKLVVTDPRLRDMAFILETPKRSDKQDRLELMAVRRLAGRK